MFFSCKLFFVLLAFTTVAFAQTTSSISGALHDISQMSELASVLETVNEGIPMVPGQSEVDALIAQLQNTAGK